ncbi:MAG TPA: hypothetical protein VMU86_05705, partial [Steroidobacteraceae bacterium]|nr:hypothetical protein [Steroidobacteraceae bacterium]
DEFAYVRTDEFSANPDVEVLAAIRPSMATVPGAMLLVASSPYARRGAVFDAFREHHGQPSDVLVWKAPTRIMNPTVPQRFIDREIERDPARAAAEYMAEFRTDIEGFVSREVVDAAVVPGRYELPKRDGIHYFGFTDPAGGSGSDSMTLSIAHRDRGGCSILDCIREVRPPFGPEVIVAQFAATLKSYGVKRVVGDHYAGEWPREQFRKHGVDYITSDNPKSAIYLECLPLLNSGKVELLDDPRLVAQLCGLERRTARSGRDTIDHAPSAHDDVCNATLGALLAASAAKSASMIMSPKALRKMTSMAPRERFGPLGPVQANNRNRFGLAR